MKSKLLNLFFILCLVGLLISVCWTIAYDPTTKVFGTIAATTAIQITGFMLAAYIIFKAKDMLKKLDKEWIDFLIMLFFLLLLLAFFETLFTFNYWFSEVNIQGTTSNLDKLNYTAEKGLFKDSSSYFHQVSLNVMTKLYSSLFFLFLYCLYTLNDIRRENLPVESRKSTR